MPKFDLGHVVMTPGVQETLERHPDGKGMEELLHVIFQRHAEADWSDDGVLDDYDVQANESALQSGGRLVSVYFLSDGTPTGTKIYVITEWDRSATTAFLPSEY